MRVNEKESNLKESANESKGELNHTSCQGKHEDKNLLLIPTEPEIQ